MLNRYVAVFVLFVCALCAGCGGDSKSPTAPSSPPPASIAGGWQGTFTTSNYTPEVIQVDLQQVGENVTGTYVLPGANASGNITGTVTPTQFIGQVTFSIGQLCTLAGAFTGTVSGTSIRLSSAGFATGSCNIANPAGVSIALQRR